MVHPAPLESTAFPPVTGEAIVLTGPTAGGKSRVALQVAQRLNAEIISLDSIAVYCGMDIGTAKPTADERTIVAHHLIDVVCPTQEFSAAHYLAIAAETVREILERGKRPLFVGGTPMYLKALLYGFDPGPPADWDFRKAIEADLLVYGQEALHQRLQQVDPLSAHRLPATDTRRIIRALEVAYLTGVPLSHRQTQFERNANDSTRHAFAIAWPRETLHARIESRVNAMFEQGLVDEVQGLLDKHGALSRTAASAVGYREVIEHLTNGKPIDAAKQEVVFHTRQLARRQETWFRSLPMLRSMPVEADSELDRVADEIVRQVGC
jgi:tRNA dimethylallyltransferase